MMKLFLMNDYFVNVTKDDLNISTPSIETLACMGIYVPIYSNSQGRNCKLSLQCLIRSLVQSVISFISYYKLTF